MEKLAKDIVDSAISGKMKQSVLKHYRDFVYHSYVYECFLKLPSFSEWNKPKLKTLNEILSQTLTLDMVFKLYVEGMACMNHWLPSIHWQLFNYKNEPTGLKECFLYLHDTILLRHHIQNYMEKLGYGPKQAHITISKYQRDWFTNDPYRVKRMFINIIMGNGSIREQYEKSINTISLVNDAEYTRKYHRNLYKIHKIRLHKTDQHRIYQQEFYKMYMECCKHWNVVPNIQLIKIPLDCHSHYV